MPDLRARLPDWAQRPLAPVAAVAAVAVAGLVAFSLLRAPAGPAPRLTLPQAGAATGPGAAAGAAAPGPAAAGGPSPATSAATLTVHAAGAVASPGVYAVAGSARVADVLTAAGGVLPEADVDRLNLASKVADGDRIYVPREGESPEAAPMAGSGAGATAGAGGGGSPAAGSGAPAAPIDLNTATLEQLDTLPGIGPATAQAIVTYRTRQGRFRSVTELLEVPGIGPAKLEAVRPLVKV
ncbi:MAG: helix-hairpin-helix domain-containing protein [Acidimicrobiia bacterium]